MPKLPLPIIAIAILGLLVPAVVTAATTERMWDNVMAAEPVRGEAILKSVVNAGAPNLKGTASFERYQSSMGSQVVIRVTGLPDTNGHWWDVRSGTCDQPDVAPPLPGTMIAEAGPNKLLVGAGGDGSASVMAVFPNAMLTPGKAKYLAIYPGNTKVGKGAAIACGNISSIDPDILRMEIADLDTSQQEFTASYAHWRFTSRVEPSGSVRYWAKIQLTVDRALVPGSYPWRIHRGTCQAPGPMTSGNQPVNIIADAKTKMVRLHDIELTWDDAQAPLPPYSVVIYKKDLQNIKRDQGTWDPRTDAVACGDGWVIPRYSW